MLDFSTMLTTNLEDNLTTPCIRVMISVDWEGRCLQESNIGAMKRFREDHPSIPLQHFLNAAYYTKTDADPLTITEAIHSVVAPTDEHGLHIHGWRSLFEAAGVTPKTLPTFFNQDTPLKSYGDDWGHEVDISVYSVEELRQTVRYSVETLVQYGFEHPRSFRAGGWMGGPTVLEAINQEGFLFDCSAVWNSPLEARWGKHYLYRQTQKLWPHMTTTSQPFSISVPSGKIQEVPNNGCLADYMSSEDILAVFLENLEVFSRSSSSQAVVSIGFHQETAEKFLHVIDAAIPSMRELAKDYEVDLEFTTNKSLH